MIEGKRNEPLPGRKVASNQGWPGVSFRSLVAATEESKPKIDVTVVTPRSHHSARLSEEDCVHSFTNTSVIYCFFVFMLTCH